MTTTEQRIATIGLDLELCDSPEDAIALLRRASDKFYADASELQSAWHDKNASKFWSHLARELDRLADRSDKYLQSHIAHTGALKMTTTTSNSTAALCVIEIWDDRHSERAGFYRAFWVSAAEVSKYGTGASGSPVVGYCSPGGTHRTIRATIAECRRLGYDDPIYRNGRKIA